MAFAFMLSPVLFAVVSYIFLNPLAKLMLSASEQEQELLVGYATKLWTAPKPEMFRAIGNGRWETLCVVGGYGHPLGVLRAHRPDIGWGVSGTWRSALFAHLLVEVSEYEVSLTWADRAGNAEVRYFDRVGGPDTQHFCWCTGSPADVAIQKIC
ncbi:MAG: hypothetical protein ABL907_25515 [Hyphomicrobium sp.]